MNVVNVGYNYRHPDDFCINRPHGSGDYILLVLKSDAFFILNGKKQPAAPNSVIILKKGTPQFYGALTGEFINDWIHFEINEEEASRIENLGISFDSIMPMGDTTVISGFIKSMFNEKYSQNIYKENSLNLYFELILLKLSEKAKMPDLKKENMHYDELYLLRNEIYLTPNKNWKIDDISKKMRLSRSYIQHLYKAFFDSSIIFDITSARIEHAKYLLSSTDMTINCISQLCGYNNDVHFMRTFKKILGVTPSQYRIQMHISKNEVKESKSQNPFCL